MMKKENLFREKFRLLSSQEHNEDIKWSSSSSSEAENTSYNDKHNLEKRKYRRRKRKKNVLNNVSNLDITFTDSCKDHDRNVTEKSPILKSKTNVSCVSPILTSVCYPPNRKADAISPVLSSKRVLSKSPVLNIKSASPNFTGRVRKKLCYEKNICQEENIIEFGSSFKIIDNKSTEVNDKVLENKTEIIIKSESNSITTLSESDSSLKSKLVDKVKNFFDSHFSSEQTSQNISDTPTPTDSSKVEDNDILSCKTQSVTNIQAIKTESTINSDTSTYVDRNIKKVKYKRGGLAFRLNELLKKQNAHISLWQHERYLADNSNFVIPKEEYIVFRIQMFIFKYGCYLIKAVDTDNLKYLILISKKYVNNTIIVESVLKLYEPYKILPTNSDVRIIVNVCKFECAIIKS